jgi:hypothetical protein
LRIGRRDINWWLWDIGGHLQERDRHGHAIVKTNSIRRCTIHERSSEKGISMAVPANGIFVEGLRCSSQVPGGYFSSIGRLSLQRRVQNKPSSYLMLPVIFDVAVDRT